MQHFTRFPHSVIGRRCEFPIRQGWGIKARVHSGGLVGLERLPSCRFDDGVFCSEIIFHLPPRICTYTLYNNLVIVIHCLLVFSGVIPALL